MNLQSHRSAKNRACFVLKVKPQLLPEFLAAHRSVWPEYLRAFQYAGIDSYTSFVSSDGLFVGYLEAENPAGALAARAATEIDVRWQTTMAQFFEPRAGAEGGTSGIALMTEAFDLKESLPHLR